MMSLQALGSTPAGVGEAYSRRCHKIRLGEKDSGPKTTLPGKPETGRRGEGGKSGQDSAGTYSPVAGPQNGVLPAPRSPPCPIAAKRGLASQEMTSVRSAEAGRGSPSASRLPSRTCAPRPPGAQLQTPPTRLRTLRGVVVLQNPCRLRPTGLSARSLTVAVKSSGTLS